MRLGAAVALHHPAGATHAMSGTSFHVGCVQHEQREQHVQHTMLDMGWQDGEGSVIEADEDVLGRDREERGASRTGRHAGAA